MATHVLITPDGQQFPIRNQEKATAVVQCLSQKKNFYLEDNYFVPSQGMRVQRIGTDSDVNQSSRISTEKFLGNLQLPEGEKTAGFWQMVLHLNLERRQANRRWYSSDLVQTAKSESGFSNPKDIFDFLDHEYETLQPLKRTTPPSSHRYAPLNSSVVFCGKCENGWRPGVNGWTYCSCRTHYTDAQQPPTRKKEWHQEKAFAFNSQV